MNFQVNENIFLILRFHLNDDLWAGRWSLCYNFSCMFMSVLLQLANCALERETKCDVAPMLVRNTPKFSVIDCVPRSGVQEWGGQERKNTRFEDS
jgi:hypothetical protein